MKCARCSRPIFKTPAATVKTRRGIAAYGPKCAGLMGLTESAARARATQATASRRRRRAQDDAQLQLDLEESQA